MTNTTRNQTSRMDASIVFVPGMCSDDGRALSGWWSVYTRKSELRNTKAFWNEPRIADTREAAEAMCKANGWEVR